MIQTRARPDSNAWRITGRKIWTTNATIADWIMAFAVTDPARAAARRGGISAFFLPTTAPPFQLQRVVPLHDDIGGAEAQSTLDDVRVEPWQLVVVTAQALGRKVLAEGGGLDAERPVSAAAAGRRLGCGGQPLSRCHSAGSRLT